MKISQVVLPVAGWGTRSLPASKNIPKEMLPVFNKPVIQYVVEEAVRAGIQEVIFVTNRHKSVVTDHFDRNIELEELLAEAGKIEQLKAVQEAASMVEVMAVRQKQQMGLGHAVGCARSMVPDDYFAVMVGDDFIVGDDAGLIQLVEAAKKYNMPCIGVMEVPADKIDKYHSVHPMEKGHHFTFFACVTVERVDFLKLYPEQAAEGRFSIRSGGMLYACCSRHGLVRMKLPAPIRRSGRLPQIPYLHNE